jgi:hypothetical protein
MATWAEFTKAEPELAAFGWELLREELGYAYLALVDRRGAPRVHPVIPFVAFGSLYVSLSAASPKVANLRVSPRYMLHATVGDNDTEFNVRGHAREVIDLTMSHALQESQELNQVELLLDSALFTLDIDRVDAAIWDGGPARRQTWKAQSLVDHTGSGRDA